MKSPRQPHAVSVAEGDLVGSPACVARVDKIHDGAIELSVAACAAKPSDHRWRLRVR